jgi:3',5'-cyclic AMP phosphodiesterase CpdA
MPWLVSDIHFGHKSTKREDIDRFLSTVRDAEPFDSVVVIAGDLTQVASRSDYEQAEGFIRVLTSMDTVVVVTPGNHDFAIPGLRGFWTDKMARVIPAKVDGARRRFKKSIMQPVLDQALPTNCTRYHDKEDGFDTITVVGRDVYVALRSIHKSRPAHGVLTSARIRTRQIQWALATIRRDRLEDGRRLHLVTHRSLWKDHHAAMRMRARFEEELLSQLPFHPYIHGHNHRPFIKAETGAPESVGILHISLPTLSGRAKEKRGQVKRSFARWDPETPGRLTIFGPDGTTELG